MCSPRTITSLAQCAHGLWSIGTHGKKNRNKISKTIKIHRIKKTSQMINTQRALSKNKRSEHKSKSPTNKRNEKKIPT